MRITSGQFRFNRLSPKSKEVWVKQRQKGGQTADVASLIRLTLIRYTSTQAQAQEGEEELCLEGAPTTSTLRQSYGYDYDLNSYSTTHIVHLDVGSSFLHTLSHHSTQSYRYHRPHITDRIIIVIIIMRINILAVAAIVQLSSLRFASANHCWKSLDDYGCGAGYKEPGYFDIDPDYNECICCCRQEDGGGYHENTCDGIKSSDKGCGSCMGERACYDASNSKIGDDSCVHQHSCKEMKDSFIKEYSCRSQEACAHTERTHVGTHSCGIGSDSHQACSYTKDSTIGDYSCQTESACYGMKRTYVGRNSCGIGGKENTYACLAWDSTIGDNSCQKEESCYAWLRQFTGYGENLKIGNNACNMKRICYKCEDNSVVPDDACNGDLDDTYINTRGDTSCNYCSSAYHSTTSTAQYTATSTNGGRRLNDEDLNNACKDLANKLLNYTDVSIQDYPAFRNFVSESITDTCNNGGTFSNRFDFITDSDKGTCTIKIDRLSNMRLKNGDEISAKDYIGLKVAEYDLEPIEGFTRDYLNATDLVIEKYCDNGGSKSSKSSITSNANGAKSGKDGKSSQAVLKKRHRMREPKSKKD